MKKRKAMKKRQSQKAHAIRRAHERYGLSVSVKDLRALCTVIQEGKSRFVGRASIRVAMHVVEYDGAPVCVAYDTTRQMICSFLPLPLFEAAQ